MHEQVRRMRRDCAGFEHGFYIDFELYAPGAPD
jgi:hypothetical protein